MSRKKTFIEFKEEFLKKWGSERYILDKESFVDSHTKMKAHCPKHGEFWMSPKNLMRYECRKCSYEKRAINQCSTTGDFVKKAQDIHGLKYDYSKVEYKNAKDKVCLVCFKHGEFWQTPNDHLSGKGCPLCNESHLEREVKNILDKNNKEYIFQYKTSWLGKQSLDFYLPEYNIAIECQGKQHFGFGGWSENFNFKQQFKLDKIKKELCELNNLKIIYVVDDNLVNKIPDFITYKDDVFSIKKLDECIKLMI